MSENIKGEIGKQGDLEKILDIIKQNNNAISNAEDRLANLRFKIYGTKTEAYVISALENNMSLMKLIETSLSNQQIFITELGNRIQELEEL